MATRAATIKKGRAGAKSVRLVATNTAYASVCKKAIKRLPTPERAHVEVQGFRSFAEVSLSARKTGTTLFLSRLADIPKDLKKLAAHGQAKQVLILEGLPIEAMASRLTQLDIRTPERLHLAAGRSTEHLADLVYRLLSGITDRKGKNPIVDAWIEDEQIEMLTASFERMSVPLEKLAKVIGRNREEIASFEIDEDGRFVYWPHADAHYGWEQFHQLVDPTAALESKQRSAAFNQRYGAAIRALREEHDLSQSDIHGVTERHLRRIEHGEQPASKSVLQSLADATGLALEHYLRELASRMRR